MRLVARSRLSRRSCASLGLASDPKKDAPPNDVTEKSDCAVSERMCLGGGESPLLMALMAGAVLQGLEES